jgi:hypothetical protein
MRRTALIGLALLLVIPAFGVPASAQNPDTSTDLKIELKRKRHVVPPPADTGAGASEAEAAAQRIEEQRRLEELRRKAMPRPSPPLDESVVEGSRAKQLHELPKVAP